VGLGLGLLSDRPPLEVERIARRAEAAGVDSLSVFHDLGYPPAIGPLLLMARVTERVRLGPAGLNPSTLHPYEIAGQAAFLDRVSNGRAYLGLVKGAWLDRLALEEERPLRTLQEAVEVVTRLLSGDDSGFAGDRFTLAPGMRLEVEPLRPRIPLLIGTWGERTARWAAGVADELKLGGTANPDFVRHVRAWVGEDVRVVTGCVTVVDEDAAAARERARAAVAPYLDVVARLDPTLAPGEPPLDRFAIAGTPEHVAGRVRELWDAGADRVELGTPQGLTTEGGVELICDRVLPLLRA
jgi:5,10-methylenetetrahydromethanopterin reductase